MAPRIPGMRAAGVSSDARELVAQGATRVLRIPLAGKLIGANLAVILGGLVAALMLNRAKASPGTLDSTLALTLLAGTTINVWLTWVALRPIRDIHATVLRVRRGDSAVRVGESIIADADIRTIGDTVNRLLDDLEEDQLRMDQLTGEIIHAEERERARISQELRDSIAQSLAAVTFQLAALTNECRDPAILERIGEIRTLAASVLKEVDVLSHSVHPRILADFGLFAGLRRLASELTSSRVAVEARLVSGDEAQIRSVGPQAEAALYSIAETATQNALLHARAKRVRIEVGSDNGTVSLRVIDDGIGFDVEAAEVRHPGMGLFKMRKRAAMIGASLYIDSPLGRGTTVDVTLPATPTTLTRH